jgi:hypothetical protein
MLLAGIIPGLALLLLSLIYVGYFLIRLVADPSSLLIPMFYGFGLALTWFAWIHVPFALIRLIRRRRRGT